MPRHQPDPANCRNLFLTVVIITALTHLHSAVADTWDNSAGTSQWSTATNWLDNTEPAIGDAVTFPTPIPFGLATITLISGEFASSLTFNDSYTLSAGNLNMGADSIAVASGKTVTITTALVGSGGLTKTGTGVLNLYPVSSNSFTGPVTIEGFSSKIVIRTNLALGNTANAVNINGGTLRIDGVNGTTFLMSRPFSMGALGGTLELINNPTVRILDAMVANSNPMTITGTGYVDFNANTTRSGSTFITGTRVRLNTANSLGTGGIVLNTNAALEIHNGVNCPAFVMPNNDTTLAGEGGPTIFSGVCNVNASGNVTLSAGPLSTDTLQLGNGTPDVYRNGNLSTITIINGSGTVQCNVANNYVGNWRIDHGTLRIGHADALGTGTSPIVVNLGSLFLDAIAFNRPVMLNNVGKLDFNPGGPFSSTVTIAPNAGVTLGIRSPGAQLLGTAPNALTGGSAASVISVAGGSSGILELRQPSDYVGRWQLSATVDIDADDRLGNPGNTVTLGGAGVLRSSVPITLAREITPETGTLRPMGADTTMTLLAPLTSNANLLQISGEGTVILTAASSRTGETLINSGTLRVTDANAIGTNAAHVQVGQGMPPAALPTLEVANVAIENFMHLGTNGATLRGTGSGAGSSGSITVPSGVRPVIATGASTSDVFTVGGQIENGGGMSNITVSGAGRVVRTGTGNYLGDWILSSGALEIDADNRLCASASNVSLAGGTLATTAAFNSGRIFSANGGAISTGALTTLTLTNAMANTSGSLTKEGTGTLVLNVPSSRTGPTTINAGTINVSGTTSGLGSGTVTINNTGLLVMTDATYTSLAGGIILNSGGILRSFGTSAYSSSGFPAVENGVAGGPVNVAFNIPVSTGSLTIQSAIRNAVDATPSFATIIKQGSGTLILRTGGVSASDIFSGAWRVDGGIVQIGPNLSGGEVLNALGFKNGDAKQANTITLNSGTLAVGAFNSVAGDPDFLRANIVLAGGAIASTNGVDAKYSGHFVTSAGTTSRVLVFDPVNPTAIRNVTLVAGAASPSNNIGDTTWGANSTLVVDAGATSNGTFHVIRTGGTVTVGAGATILVNPGAIFMLSGSVDVLSDGVHRVDIQNNSAVSLHVAAGTKTAGRVTGLGNTLIDFGATLSTANLSQNILTSHGTTALRVDTPGTPGSALSSVNQLTVTGALRVTLAGNSAGTDFTRLAVSGNATLGGTLNITRAPGFEPPLGASFVIMTFGTRTGTFASIAGLVAGPGRVFRVNYNTNDVTLSVEPFPSGDMTCDGLINPLDYNPFITALVNPNQYHLQFPTCDVLNGDLNHDQVLDGDDLQLFVNCLISGNCS